MDRHRGERSSGGDRHRPQSRWSGSPTNGGNHRREGFSGPGAGGGSGAGRFHPYKSGQEFEGGFRAGGVGPTGGFSGGPGPMPGPRHGGFSSSRGDNSPDREVRSGYVKLFIGSVPRTATEEEVRPLFEEHGNVIEVAFIKDKKTGEQQGCCFVKYGTTEEAERAIRALHNNYTLSNGIGPIQVRYADGERGHGDRGHGVTENKLFVAQMNKQATAQEIEEIFLPFGQIEDVYIMRDAMKQSRGCGFVKFSTREQATEAMNNLNGMFTMRGCDQPLIVRFADPKRPRTADSRGGGGPAFGGPGFSPRSDTTLVIRPTANLEEQRQRMPSDAWDPSSPQGMVGPPHFNNNNFGPDNPPPGSRSGPITTSSDSTSVFTPPIFPSNGSLPSLSAAAPTAQLGANPSMHEIRPGMGPQNPSMQNPPQNFPPIQLQNNPQQIPQNSFNQSQTPTQNQTFPPPAQMQNPQQSFNPQQQFRMQPQMQQMQPQMMLQQQQQALQSSFQSSQQAIMQLQQQLQIMQQQGGGLKQQQGGNTPSVGAQGAMMPSNNLVPPPIPSSTPPACNWTEHTSPEGFKYYYNSITKESKWEKPEEFSMYEQQKLMMLQQQMPQLQQPQMQMKPFMQPPVQFQGGQQGLQQDINFAQLQAAGSNIDPTRIQQGIQAAQEWAWKNKPPGP